MMNRIRVFFELCVIWIFSETCDMILKESIRFRADKKSSFIQKIKLL